MKKILKNIVAIIFYYFILKPYQIWQVITKSSLAEVRIINFHYMCDTNEGEIDYIRAQLAVSRDSFKNLLTHLKKCYHVIPLNAVVPFLNKEFEPVKPAMAITFDDGYANNYTVAYPLLKEQKIPATIFLTTDLINTNQYLWWDELTWELQKRSNIEIFDLMKNIHLIKVGSKGYSKNELINHFITSLKDIDEDKRRKIIHEIFKTFNKSNGRPSMMLTWEQIKEMRNHSISFGAHTKTHFETNIDNVEILEDEIGTSIQIVKQNLRQPVTMFAYPSGKSNEIAEGILESNDVDLALTTENGTNKVNEHPFRLKRIHISERDITNWRGKFSIPMFELHITGLFLFINSWRKKLRGKP